jgi:outer membrane protein
MKKLILFVAGCLLAGNVAFAQTPKIGYINSNELLASMPEVKKADSSLQAYSKSFQDLLESMSKEYEKKVQDYQSQEKTMSDAIKEVKVKEIQDLQGRIQGLQQSAQEKVSQKKQELYSPILEKADKAIKDVAKEKGFDYIFDSGGGTVLYYKESDNNIMDAVKTKLGIKKSDTGTKK